MAKRFEAYLKIIQPILQENNHEIQGHGIHPLWQENDNSPVKIERYKMLMAFPCNEWYRDETHPLSFVREHLYGKPGSIGCKAR